jgi:hypothetical protein
VEKVEDEEWLGGEAWWRRMDGRKGSKREDGGYVVWTHSELLFIQMPQVIVMCLLARINTQTTNSHKNETHIKPQQAHWQKNKILRHKHPSF